MNKEWSELNKSFQELIIKKETFDEGKQKLLELRKKLFETIMNVKNGFNPKGYSLIVFPNSKGYDSKTMAYSIYHITRIEDIVCNTIINNLEQVFDKNDYQKRLNINIKTTGNELNKDEIISFSESINIIELFNYFEEVYLESNDYISNLKYEDIKKKIPQDKKNYLYASNYVSHNEASIWLIDYWCSKNILGLLKMPFSRHWIMHIEAFLRIKNEIIRIEKKKISNRIAVCGFSCNHCFLGEWCSGCRSEYNCCSYATLFEDHICPNVKCSKEKDLEGCYDCPLLEKCEIGFYNKENNDGNAANVSARFIHKYGKDSFIKVLNEMHKTYEFYKIQEMIKDSYNGIKILEDYLKNI